MYDNMDIITWTKILVPLHPLSNIKIIKYFNHQLLTRIKDGAYVLNPDDKQNKETHSVSLFINRYTAVYF